VSRSEAFVEALNQATQHFGRGWGFVDSDARCSEEMRLKALNIAAYFAARDAGCSDGQCVITYFASRCDEEAIAGPTRAEIETAAMDKPWFKEMPENQGRQE
jgi:hypothetical protein